MTKILGIDEAGRGPVIGPLIIAGVMVEEGDEKKFKGVKDSKLLSHKKRIEFAKIIKENSDYEIISVYPEEIDSALNSLNLNLNWLEAHKQAEIINKLNPDIAIIDCPSVNPQAYENYLKKLLNNKKIKLIIEHKADVNYPVCSAASILAKVKREDEMDLIKKKYGDTGAGYPADPKTKLFLKNKGSTHPEIFRKTWATYKKYSEENIKTKQKDLGEF